MACQKNVESPEAIEVENLIVFQDEEISQPFDVVAHGDVALCVYIVQHTFMMRLVNSEGEVLWTKPIGHNIGITDNPFAQVNYLHKIIYDHVDDCFSIFFGNHLLKVNKQGEFIEHNDQFLNLSDFKILDILQNPLGDYILAGTRANRGFVAKYTHGGEEVFRNFFFVSLPGANAFTSVVEHPEGGYLVAGSKESVSEEIENAVFVAHLSESGDFLWTKVHNINPALMSGTQNEGINIFGRELAEISNNHFIYIFNSSHYSDPNQVVSIMHIDNKGEKIKTSNISYATANYAAGISNNITDATLQFSVGRGLVRNVDGTFSGLVNRTPRNSLGLEWAETVNFATAFAYSYQLDANGELVEASNFDANHYNYFTSISQFANGQKIAIATSESFGESQRLSLIIY